MIWFIGILLFLIFIYYLYNSSKNIVNEASYISPYLNEVIILMIKYDKLISDINYH